VKPLTAAEVRAEVERLPAEFRVSALNLLASAFDEGMTAGLVGAARNKNPFLPPPLPPKTKGKAR
jgi:hypothetical protein